MDIQAVHRSWQVLLTLLALAPRLTWTWMGSWSKDAELEEIHLPEFLPRKAVSDGKILLVLAGPGGEVVFYCSLRRGKMKGVNEKVRKPDEGSRSV